MVPVNEVLVHGKVVHSVSNIESRRVLFIEGPLDGKVCDIEYPCNEIFAPVYSKSYEESKCVYRISCIGDGRFIGYPSNYALSEGSSRGPLMGEPIDAERLMLVIQEILFHMGDNYQRLIPGTIRLHKETSELGSSVRVSWLFVEPAIKKEEPVA